MQRRAHYDGMVATFDKEGISTMQVSDALALQLRETLGGLTSSSELRKR